MSTKTKKVKVTMTMSPDTWAEMDEFSRELGISKSSLIEMLFRMLKAAGHQTVPQMFEAVIQEVMTITGGKLKTK